MKRTYIALAPIRICDLGGWADTWFAKHGTVLNIAVSPYAECRVEVREVPEGEERFFFNIDDYGDRYKVDPHEVTFGKHPLLEACVKAMEIPRGLDVEVTLHSAVPGGSSTGTSAAVTVAETAQKLLMAANCYCYNTLALNAWSQGNPNSAYEFRNCMFHVANPDASKVSPATKLTESPVVDSANDDIRPKTGSAVVGKGERVNNIEFIKYMTGGYYHETFPAGAFPIGASSDVAVPVTVVNKKGVAVESALNAGYASAAHPLTLTATLTDRTFLGWKVNGAEEFASTEKTLALVPTAGIASYSIEGFYKAKGLSILVR